MDRVPGLVGLARPARVVEVALFQVTADERDEFIRVVERFDPRDILLRKRQVQTETHRGLHEGIDHDRARRATTRSVLWSSRQLASPQRAAVATSRTCAATAAGFDPDQSCAIEPTTVRAVSASIASRSSPRNFGAATSTSRS